jgi:hypothetical protein
MHDTRPAYIANQGNDKIPRMSAKKRHNRSETIKDAATGYTAVVLALICFLLVLTVVIAAVRFVSGLSAASNATTTAGATTKITRTV